MDKVGLGFIVHSNLTSYPYSSSSEEVWKSKVGFFLVGYRDIELHDWIAWAIMSKKWPCLLHA